jgi:hypothetical protein
LKVSCSYLRSAQQVVITSVEPAPNLKVTAITANEAAPIESSRVTTFLDPLRRMVSYFSAQDDIKTTVHATRRKFAAIFLFVMFLLVIISVVFLIVARVRTERELEENRRALAEETRGFNSKYTPILGDE